MVADDAASAAAEDIVDRRRAVAVRDVDAVGGYCATVAKNECVVPLRRSVAGL